MLYSSLEGSIIWTYFLVFEWLKVLNIQCGCFDWTPRNGGTCVLRLWILGYLLLLRLRWMDALSVLRPFNSISVISRWWKGEHERLCAMKRRLGSGRISPPAGFEPATPWSEVGSANCSDTGRFIKPKNTGDLFHKSWYNYHNDPKFSDRPVQANSADPDQTAIFGLITQW